MIQTSRNHDTRRTDPRSLDVDRYGPWAVVTGASSGIGRGFAHRLAAEGCDVVLAARRTDALSALGAELSTAHGVEHRVVTVDLAEPHGPADLIRATRDLDVGLLVSNAGTGMPGHFLTHDLADLHRIVRLNSLAHLELAHHFGKRFVERGRGGMVLVSAGGALHGLPHMANDSATKSYVLNLGEGLHYELAPAGVDVTVLLPFAVDTPILDLFGVEPDSLPLKPQSVEECVDEALKALRKGRPTVVSGRAMRLLTRLTPRSVSIRMNGRMLGRAVAALSERSGE